MGLSTAPSSDPARSITALPVVHGYRDYGYMLAGRTRWQPRRVFCTETSDHADKPGIEYVVKYLQGRTGAAALISEVVCHALFQAAGFSVLDAALVQVRPGFAASYAGTDVDYEVRPGLHFGTVRRHDVEPGPPRDYESLADARELIDIWVFDSWLMTIDREGYGNLLMQRAPGQKWSLIPTDQSDCLGGADTFSSGRYLSAAESRGSATYVAPRGNRDSPSTGRILRQLLNRALLEWGAEVLREAIERVRSVKDLVRAVCQRVPDAWWTLAEVEHNELVDCLMGRARRIGQIADLDRWEGMSDAVAGGHVLDI